MLINRAPHPNAAKVFLNWLLSREGQTTWVQVTAQNSRRIDVEGPPSTAPDQKAKYRIVNHEDYNHYISEAQAVARDIFR
jgi:ABC-type Fe3+ transport system substrate-binding protein